MDPSVTMESMPLPRLRLQRAPDPTLWFGPIAAASRILWLEGSASPPPELRTLRADLGERVVAPRVRAVPVPGPSPGRNPWAHRQDRQEPLRWGEGEGLEGPTTLAACLGDQRPFDALVFATVCVDLADQPLRALLRQLPSHLAPDTPFLLCEPNGRSALAMARNLVADQRGEGRGTARTVEELRRLLETCGLGLSAAWGLGGAGKRGRLARRILGEDLGADWLLVTGRAIRGGEDLR